MRLEIKNVSAEYSGKQIITNVNFSVADGEFVSILGESGSGKSTLLKVISGILPAARGEIFVDDEKVTKISKHFAYMPQDDLLLPWWNIMQNVCLAAKISGDLPTAEKRAKKLLEEFGLAEYKNSYPKELSGGMRQRIAFLRTALSSADIWMLDEPFAALDVITRGELQDWLLDLREKISNTVLLVTHDIEEAIYLSDKIYIIRGTPSKIVKEIKISTDYRNRQWLYEQGNLKKDIFEAIKGA
ncbi:MAG: ABC transporter ATP-binding protein [Clostridiales bacterium]|nr:ABC transporter ATP-binding protein [Clostridiales bacterium]